jgi:predicted kinase
MAGGGAVHLVKSGHRCPGLLIMVGAPGSGKSYLGRTLAAALGAELIQTDAVRKELFPQPSYSSAEAATVYSVCHRRIAAALAEGRCVVFDGTNLRERRRRTLYQLAERAMAPALIVVAYASEATIRERLHFRAAGGDPTDQSDADWGIYLRMRRDTELVPRPHIVVNTAANPGPVIRLLQHRLREPYQPPNRERRGPESRRRGRPGPWIDGG